MSDDPLVEDFGSKITAGDELMRTVLKLWEVETQDNPDFVPQVCDLIKELEGFLLKYKFITKKDMKW